MIYANDQWVQFPIKDLYDSNMMLASVQAAKDMYEKAQQEFKDFKKEYSDFTSPFQKDMERYSQMINGVKKYVQDAYNNGIDVLRSPEGRRILFNAINSVDPGEYSAMKTNAKLGYAYLEAMQKLRQSGKYSEAQELFDIMQSGGTKFSDFSTLKDENGQYRIWDRISPIEATSLRDLTYKHYEHRTPRDLDREDFKNDPMLKGVTFDPRYQYTGYLYSDLMKVSPGVSASLIGDPRAAFFRDQAKQKVAASGQPVTDEAVEAQFQRDIADANTWALVDPTKKADDFAKMDYQYKQSVALENLSHNHAMDLQRLKNEAGGAGDNKYSATMNIVVDSEGAMQKNLTNYLSTQDNNKFTSEEKIAKQKLNDIVKNPSKYSKSEYEQAAYKYVDLIAQREAKSMEGVADQVLSIGKGKGSIYFTRNPEDLNNILRSLSSSGEKTTLNRMVQGFKGTPGGNGGTFVNRDRLCGVGEVMQDVLYRGYADGKKHEKIAAALKLFDEDRLGKYKKSWTSGSFDIRNEVDDTMLFNGNEQELYATGNVLSGSRYYYIEVSNSPTSDDECCWFKVNRDVANGGGIDPVESSIVERIDDQYMHDFSHTNVIGNIQSSVTGYNK